MNADAMFAAGRDHVVCQDYARAGVVRSAPGGSEFPFAVVSDGCSSSAHTDVGARLLTSTLLEAWRGHQSRKWPGVISYARLLAKLAGYSAECLDATLLFALAEGTDRVKIGAIGDGIVAARRIDGVIDFWQIDYGGIPGYLSYALSQERTKAFLAHTHGVRTISHYQDGSLMSQHSDRVDPADDSIVWSMNLPVDQYRLVVLLSDGASSFRERSHDGSNRQVRTWEVVNQVCAVKTTAGSFMTRRCRRFLRRYCTQHHWTHADDFAAAGLALGNTPVKVWVDGGKAVNLTQQDFVGQGGQGQVYARGDSAFKIYTDQRAMILPAKLVELARIKHDSVLLPEAMLLDRKGNPIGFTMPFVRDSFTLCQTFPRAFRERHGITEASIMKLVEQFRDAVEAVHRAGALIVDLNEMNVLVSADLKDLFLIDVDSFATANFPPTGVMETIRDRHSATFSELTDWFAFAVVTFQMFVGIHPFRGKHPVLRGLDARMQANVSVLNAAVRMPRSVYPLDVIPPGYHSWYQALFEHGRRIAPPARGKGGSTVVPRMVRIPDHGAQIVAQKIAQFPGPILDYWPTNTGMLARLDGALVRNGRTLATGPDKCLGIINLADGTPVAIMVQAGRVMYVNTESGTETPLHSALARPVIHADRLYGIAGAAVLQVVPADVAGTIVPSIREVARVIPHATQLFPGVAVQNLLGSTYASIFHKPGAAAQVRLDCLDDYKIVDARCIFGPRRPLASGAGETGGVLIVIGSRNGIYDRLVIRFSPNHDHHDVRVVADVVPVAPNFAVLDSGVVVSVDEDENLELFRAAPGDAAVKVVSDPGIDGQMQLASRGRELIFARGNGIYSLCMQNP